MHDITNRPRYARVPVAVTPADDAGSAIALDLQQLLEVVSSEFITTGTWPTFQFVDKTLGARGVDIDSVLETMVPGLVVIPSSGGVPPRSADPVSLTIAGLSEADVTEVVQDFLEMVKWLVNQESSFVPATSTDAEDLRVSSEQVRRGLASYRDLDTTDLLRMKTLLEAAPAMRTGMWSGNDGEWEIDVSRDIRQYRAVTTPDELATQITALSEPKTVFATGGTPVMRATVQRRSGVVPTNAGLDSHRNNAEQLAQLHDRIVHSAGRRFSSGQFADSVFASFRAVEERVRALSGLDQSGQKLMGNAFSGTPPLLALNDLISESDRDEQQGFKLIFMGVMRGIRNPKAHNDIPLVDPSRTLDYLAVASLLMRRLDDVESRRKDEVRETIEGRSGATAGHADSSDPSSVAAEDRPES